jgi:DNA-binding MarR family transcriptional regulator
MLIFKVPNADPPATPMHGCAWTTSCASHCTPHRWLTMLYKPLLEPLGLTYPQYLALLVLWERDGLTVSELGDRLFLDSGTLTPLLKRMQAAGWVMRERAADDERCVLVSLTAAGRELRDQARSVPRQLARATGCSADELVELTQRLKDLRSRMHTASDTSH